MAFSCDFIPPEVPLTVAAALVVAAAKRPLRRAVRDVGELLYFVVVYDLLDDK